MTRAVFRTRAQRILGFEVSGHSGYAEAGEDIVCAGVSSAVQMTVNAVVEIIGVAAQVRSRREDAFVSLTLPGEIDNERMQQCQIALRALLLQLELLEEECPEFLNVIHSEV